MILAKVTRSGKKEFECKLEGTGEKVTAGAKGNVLKSDESIVVGDIVRLEKVIRPKQVEHYQIVAVGERRNEIYRILIREGKRKTVAANCDNIVVITAASMPPFKRGLLDRFLIRGAQWNLPCVVVFNKMDEYNPKDFDIVYEKERLKDLNVECFEISAKFTDYKNKFLEKGLSELKEKLKGTTSIFMGHSGVGKSKTISALSDGQYLLRTQEINKSGKGSHTTTWSEIIDCGDFGLIDSPGIRTFSLDDLSPEDLPEYFPDLLPYFFKCKFSDCMHLENVQGCAFLPYYLQNPKEEKTKMLLSRLESYIRIHEEISELPHWKRKQY